MHPVLVLLLVLGLHLSVGIPFGLLYAFVAAPRIDPAAAKAPWSFRVLLVPGAALLWPLLVPALRRGLAERGR